MRKKLVDKPLSNIPIIFVVASEKGWEEGGLPVRSIDDLDLPIRLFSVKPESGDCVALPTQIALERAFFHLKAPVSVEIDGDPITRRDLALTIGGLQSLSRATLPRAERAVRDDQALRGLWMSTQLRIEDPDSVSAWDCQVRSLIELSLVDEALDTYDISHFRLIDRPENKLLAARFRMLLGQHDECRFILRELLHTETLSAEAVLLQAQSHLMSGEHETAIQLMKTLRRRSVQRSLIAGISYYRAQSISKAELELTRVAKAGGLHASEALFYLGKLSLVKGQIGDAERNFRTSLFMRDSLAAREALERLLQVTAVSRPIFNHSEVLKLLPLELKNSSSDLSAIDEWISLYAPNGELESVLGFDASPFQISEIILAFARHIADVLVGAKILLPRPGQEMVFTFPSVDIPIDLRELVRERFRLGASADPAESLEALAPSESSWGAGLNQKLPAADPELLSLIERESAYLEELAAKRSILLEDSPAGLSELDILAEQFKDDPKVEERELDALGFWFGRMLARWMSGAWRAHPIKAGLAIDTKLGRFFPLARANYIVRRSHANDSNKSFEDFAAVMVVGRVSYELEGYGGSKQERAQQLLVQYLPELKEDIPTLTELSEAVISFSSRAV